MFPILTDQHIEIARICLRFWWHYLHVMGYVKDAPGEASLKVLDKLERLGLEKPGPALSGPILRSEIAIEGLEEVLWTINDVIGFFFSGETPQCLRDTREAWFRLVCHCKHLSLRIELDVNEGAWAESREKERAREAADNETL